MTKRGKEAQDRVLAAILSLSAERGYPPTYREIGERVGLAHSAVHNHMRTLSEAGLVHEDPRTARSLRISRAGLDRLATSNYPDGLKAALADA